MMQGDAGDDACIALHRFVASGMTRIARVIPRAELAALIPEKRRIELGLSKDPAKRSRPGRGFAAMRQAPEHVAQSEFVAWARKPETIATYPELADMYAVPNFHLPPTKKINQAWNAYFKEEGRLDGMLDLVIPHSRGGFLTAILESKAPGGKLSPTQRDRARALVRAGHFVAVCYSTGDLTDAAIEYVSRVRGCHINAMYLERLRIRSNDEIDQMIRIFHRDKQR